MIRSLILIACASSWLRGISCSVEVVLLGCVSRVLRRLAA